jgi:uncharacterized protein YfaP (DUF2135 family)
MKVFRTCVATVVVAVALFVLANLSFAEEGAMTNDTLEFKMRWDTNADVDLWVTEPNGFKIWYREREGNGRRGHLLQDVTRGPGTEVYRVIKARQGIYRIQANLFAWRDARPDAGLYLGLGQWAPGGRGRRGHSQPTRGEQSLA